MEAHYNIAWSDKDNNRYDCTGYAILRNDRIKKTKTQADWNEKYFK